MTKKLYYMAHPVGPSGRFTLQDNLKNGAAWWTFLLRKGVNVCAPWLGLCHALDDANPIDRKLGMDVDLSVLTKCDGIIAVGHTFSSGIATEVKQVEEAEGEVYKLTGKNAGDVEKVLREAGVIPEVKGESPEV